MKLELKHIIPYLLHNLKALSIDGFSVSVLGVDFTTNRILNINGDRTFTIPEIKPLLRPLSDYADIDSNALCDINCDMSDQIQISEFASKRISLSSVSVGAFEILVSNHVDVFGLIDQGLALPLTFV